MDRRGVRDDELSESGLKRKLEQTWAQPTGWLGWLMVDDHKIVGKRYIITTFVFLILGGLAALAMRLQLARPDSLLIGPDLYDQLFTMHGSTMMFLFAVPVMEAFAVYLVPLMVGTRNIAFPRLNAFSYWIYLAGGILLWTAFAFNTGADNGWFSYVPLAGPEFAPGKRADIWAQMITFTELSALAVSIEIICTVFKQRAPGMTLDRIPLFVWAMVVTSFIVLLAMPAVMLSSTMLILDRLVGTHFFNPAEGGDTLLWQHLFWFFGHPEVYTIFIPATGMVSAIIATFARRPIFGYLALVLALMSIGILSFGLWVHHMFTTGLPRLGESFFTASSMMIAIPSGVQIFCWIATLWGRPLRFATPLLFVLGFIVNFVLGRTDWRHGGLGAARHPSARYLFRRGSLPLRADRRRGLSAARRGLLLVSQDDRADVERDDSAAGISGSPSSASTSLFSPCIFLACGACRVASTPIPPSSDGDRSISFQARARWSSRRALPCCYGMCFGASGAAPSLATILGTPAHWSGQRPRRRRPIILLFSQSSPIASPSGPSATRCRS